MPEKTVEVLDDSLLDDALLDSIPDLEEEVLETTVVAEDAAVALEEPALEGPDDAESPFALPQQPSPDVDGVLAQVRKDMETLLSTEMDRIQRSFGGVLLDMEAKLEMAARDLQAARADHDRAVAESTRRAAALRDLRRSLEHL